MLLEIKQANKVIRGDRILTNINLKMTPGEVVGLQGVNGSGKTMIMRLASGLMYPTTGEVVVEGKRLGKDIDFPSSLGLLIEAPAFLDYKSGFVNLELLASIRNVCTRENIECAIRRVGLDPELKRMYRKYSMGMKQRLGIAAALMEKPELIILDEPTNALDESGIEMLKRVILEERSRGAAILLSSHDGEFLSAVCDVVKTVRDGRLLGRGSDEK